jgi:hypothetical protein
MADGAFPLVPLDPSGHDTRVKSCGGRVKVSTADQTELMTINVASTKTFSNLNTQ